MLANKKFLLSFQSLKRLGVFSRKFFYEAEEMSVIKTQIDTKSQEYQVSNVFL
jgi:hypothetical protein